MTSALLEITGVDLAPPGGELRAFDLAAPCPGDTGVAGTFGLDVRGWVLGARTRARRVSFALDGTPLWQAAVEREWQGVADDHPGAPGAERPGFRAAVGSLALPREFALEARVAFGEGAESVTERMATIHGRRAQIESDHDPRFRPLMVTGFSRTGSNVLLRLLGAHPEIVAYRPFFHEPRVATYWIDVLRELTEPAGVRRQITPRTNLARRGWWQGADAPPPPLDEPDIERRLAVDPVPRLAAMCQERVDAAYAALAQRVDRAGASLFAEKQLPMHVPTMLWDLYPGAREVFLVRDFRDMVASMFRADAKWGGGPRFGRADAAGDEQFVRQLRPFAQDLLGSWSRRRERAHLVRYEDLVTAPGETVGALVEYLGVDAGPAGRRAMVESLAVRDEGSEIYRTTASPSESIGRWREELEPTVREACEAVFAPALEAFGYAGG